MHYIGIDPGVAGGLAILEDTGDIVDVLKMPETPKDLVDWLEGWYGNGAIKGRAVLERVNPGVFGARKFGQRMGVVSAFTFGKGYGRLEGILAALRIPYDQVAPATWQAALQCRTAGDKNVSKRRAQDLFPHFKITHAIADALLLAEYARRSSGWGIRPGRGVTVLPDPQGASDGEKGQQGKDPHWRPEGRGESREEFERDRRGETGDRLREELTAKERREQAGRTCGGFPQFRRS